MKRVIIVFSGLLALASVCRAQMVRPAGDASTAVAGQTVSISIDDALTIAMGSNPTIKVAGLEVERQDYVKKETWGNLLPQLSATAGYQNAIIKNKITGGLSFDPTNTVNFGAKLDLPLIVPGVYQTLKLNKEQMRAALETARGSRIALRCEVKKAFYSVLSIQQQIEVLRFSQDNVTRTVEDLKVKYANGLVAEYDLLTAEVQLSNIDPLVIQADQGLLVAKMYLKMLMGMPLDIPIALLGSLEDMKAGLQDNGQLFAVDLAGNSDLRSMDIQQDILARQIKVLRTRRMPTLGATVTGNLTGHDPIIFDIASMSGGAAGWQSNGTYIGQPSGIWTPGGTMGTWALYPPQADAPVSKAFNWQHPVSLSIGLSVPIFAGRTNVNREKQLSNSLQQLQTSRGYAEQQIEVKANTAISNIYTARERMSATSKTVGQAQKAYKIAGVRYNAGAGTILELNTAQLQLTQAQLNYQQAISDLLSAQADYEEILGNE